ncbi:glycoside hydrolase family 43 protein [Arachidicoccus rhizosphaerae]|nr:glycoside hydrolase family 43 protein [Arachidicoccus rhizosphaerae]
MVRSSYQVNTQRHMHGHFKKPLLSIAAGLLLAAVTLTGATAQLIPQVHPAKAGYSGNPVLPGWYADPEGVVYGKDYWIFPTYSARYEDQVFFDAFSSPDLVHWTRHHGVLDSSQVKWAKKAMWAPAVLEKQGKYYLFFGANDVHEGEIGGIGVAVADKPQGPYKDLLGKPLIGHIKNGAQPIDQYVFHDTDGSYYMYYGGWGHCNVVKLKNDFTGLLPLEDGTLYKEVTPDGYTEGPFMFKKGGKYYFMWSEGGWGGPDYRVAYAIADNPLGPFKRIGTILEQDSAVATGAGHHSVIKVPGEDRYYIVYHRRPLGETKANNRATCIDELHFDKDGKILPVKMTFEGVKAHRIKKAAKN